jgi:predicted DNA-binding protein YlxM (UPF0122 family)
MSKEVKENRRMTPDEINELLSLKGWRMINLAAELDVSESAVYKWINRISNPLEKYCMKMRRLLDDARDSMAGAK